MVVPFAVAYTVGVSNEDGSVNFSGRTALQSKWAMDHELAERITVVFLSAVCPS